MRSADTCNIQFKIKTKKEPPQNTDRNQKLKQNATKLLNRAWMHIDKESIGTTLYLIVYWRIERIQKNISKNVALKIQLYITRNTLAQSIYIFSAQTKVILGREVYGLCLTRKELFIAHNTSTWYLGTACLLCANPMQLAQPC